MHASPRARSSRLAEAAKPRVREGARRVPGARAGHPRARPPGRPRADARVRPRPHLSVTTRPRRRTFRRAQAARPERLFQPARKPHDGRSQRADGRRARFTKSTRDSVQRARRECSPSPSRRSNAINGRGLDLGAYGAVSSAAGVRFDPGARGGCAHLSPTSSHARAIR